MTEYELSRSAGQCFATGRTINEGDRFYSAIIETPQGLQRRDYCEAGWSGPPEEALCFFQTRLPKKEERRKVFVGDDVLIGLFQQLGEAAEASKKRFRFVLALILLRKRLLKYERTLHEAEGDYWEMRLMRDRSLHRVLDPALSETQIEELTRELGTVLSGPASELFDGEASEAAPAPEAERSPAG